MPESLKQELLHYAKYLMVNYSQDIPLKQHPVKKRRSVLMVKPF